ncbi:MAG: glycosyltransferase family 2 protein [Selenomonadaceae bacterium]|nr:glycosyltransferase family 2 protein [Selenomonadaceae bacterium]
MKISACAIIKNEEKNLPAYIEGVRNIADEIIITDTGSTDNSVKLLENLKEKFNLNLQIHHFEWIADFAAAKNFTLDKATGDWIIFLDADEYFDKKYKKKVRPLIEKIHKDTSVVGVDSPLLNIDADNNNKTIIESTQIRIFRNLPYLRYEGQIHEHLRYAGNKTALFLESDIVIIHTGYSSNLIAQKKKRNRELIFKHKELATDDVPPYYSYLAIAYYEEREYQKALETIEKGLPLIEKTDSIVLIECYDVYIKTKIRQKASDEEILEIIDNALKHAPNHPDLLMHKLTVLLESENLAEKYEEVEKLCKTIFENAKDEELRKKYFNKIDARLPYAHYALGAIYKAQNRKKEAAEEFIIALKSYRYRAYILRDLLELLEDNEKKAAKILSELYDEKADGEFLEFVFEERPRDNLYKKFCKQNRESISYKLASGKVTEAIKEAAKELEKAKKETLPNEEFKKNLREKLQILAICFLFLEINDLPKVETELNMLPPSVIAVILRFYGESLPPVDGETASYNAILKKAEVYLPKSLRERFMGIKFS